jgi:hypothetical protein
MSRGKQLEGYLRGRKSLSDNSTSAGVCLLTEPSSYRVVSPGMRGLKKSVYIEYDIFIYVYSV